LTSRLKAAGVGVVAYYSVNTDLRASLEHPDWTQVDAAGKPLLTEGRWRDVCFNSPYFRQLMLPQIRELTENYDIDGFWLDMVRIMPDGCFCPHCRKLFEQRFGRRLSADDEKFDEFRRQTLVEAMTEVRRLIRSIRPDVLITANGAGTIADHEGLVSLSRRHGQGLVDYSTIEAQPGYGNYYYVGFQSRYARCLGRPYELLNARFIRKWGEWTAKPLPQMMYEAAVMLSSGGRVAFGDQPNPDGTMESTVYDRFGELFSFLAERQGYMQQTEPVVDTAVLFTDGIADATRGADAVCCDLNLQHDLIDAPALENLSRYRLLIIPETGRIDPSALARIEAFARSGGAVLVTGRAAADNDMQAVLGASVESSRDYSIGYLPADTLECPGIPLLIAAPPYKIAPGQADTLAELQLPSCEPTPQRFVSHIYANPGRPAGRPAITLNTLGEGRAAYVGFDLFAVYWLRNHWWIKALAARCLDELRFQPTVKVSADGVVQSNLRRRGDDLYLHLVGFCGGLATGGGYPPMEHVPNLRDVAVELQLNSQPKSVTLQPGGGRVSCEYNAGRLYAKIDRLRLYEVLRIEM
ncbi:MAG: hypothetical protein SVT52_00265, partial [Planctomycetota bacterium]|nr:hypothetical protein [Planctomycetota bacterium]